MTAKITASILILLTVYLNLKHGYSGLFGKMTAAESTIMTALGFEAITLKAISIISVAVALLIIFPQTFFTANLINAASILLIITLALKTGNIKVVLTEIPYFLMPLILIWLGHPFKQ
jgi:hypothetical protein